MSKPVPWSTEVRDDRQAQGDVDRFAEGDQLDRDQSLIVVAGDHRVERAGGGATEDRVGRDRAGDVDAGGAAPLDGRREDAALLAADEALFPGVRIEAGEGEARARHAEARQLVVRQADRGVDALRGEEPRDIGERDMHGGEDDVQTVRVEQHPDIGGVREVRQQVGVAAPGQAGGGPGRFVDRGGGDGVDAARLRVANRGDDRGVGGAAGVGRDDTGLEPCAGVGGVGAVEYRCAEGADRRVGRHERGDLRADAGGVARGDGDAGGISHPLPQPPLQLPQPPELHPSPQPPADRLHDDSCAQPAYCSPAAFGSS